MNEVTTIHLGRTAFTIAADAHAELRQYLKAIERHVGSKHEEILEEVELRMAELLIEHGVTADKVVVNQDITFLKEQLGSPADFEDDGGAEEAEEPDPPTMRRLFRDPRDQILGGVASGLGAYFNVSPWIFRLIFLGLSLVGASGIVAYILLWLLVPQATSNSDFLQMQGKSVTINALTDYISSSEFEQNARRVGDQVGQSASLLVNQLAQLLRYATGTVLTAMGLVGIIWTVAAGIYVATNPERLFNIGALFPIGVSETALVLTITIVVITGFVFLLSAGVAFLYKKWPLPSWCTAALAAVMIVGSIVSIGFGAQVGPRVYDRYEAAHRSQTRTLESFDKLRVTGREAFIRYEYADRPSVTIETLGVSPQAAVRSEINDSTLHLYINNPPQQPCDWFCIDLDTVSVVVRSPQVNDITTEGSPVHGPPSDQKHK